LRTSVCEAAGAWWAAWQAPSEAEAQCAAMCEAGLVHIVSTEDMDVLTFNTPRVVRNLMSPASQKKLILEFDTAKVRKETCATEGRKIHCTNALRMHALFSACGRVAESLRAFQKDAACTVPVALLSPRALRLVQCHGTFTFSIESSSGLERSAVFALNVGEGALTRAQALEGLELTRDQFIDVCILCGCDYVPTIRGIGAVTALKLIKKHGCIEEVRLHLVPSALPCTWRGEGDEFTRTPHGMNEGGSYTSPVRWALCSCPRLEGGVLISIRLGAQFPDM
jgi:hypothetical protein